MLLVRQAPTQRSIQGELYINGVWECFTLENACKAIPPGKYAVIVDWSNRFGRLMPHVCDVPGRSGIRIHAANRPEELEGCIAPGKVQAPDFVGASRKAFDALLEKMLTALKTGKIQIEIR